jgi:hypothetical protein
MEMGAEHTAISMPASNMFTEATCTSSINVRVQLSKGDKRLLQVRNCLASPPQLEMKTVRGADVAQSAPTSPCKTEQQL